MRHCDLTAVRRLALKAAGFSPIPDDGKECHLIGWPTKTNVSDAEIIGWQSIPASRNTGLIAKTTPALDIDILNPDAADAVEELVRQSCESGVVLVRTGLAPKRLIPFRTAAPFSKIKVQFAGTRDKLEFLGAGQQFVAFGIHPDTGQPYQWHGGEPGNVLRTDLPPIDEQSARGMISAAADLLVERFGYQLERSVRYRNTAGPGDPVVVANLTEALRQLDPVGWNEDWKGWFELLMGCKFVGISLADFIEWSTSDPDYADDAGEIARQWRSVEPRHGGAFYAALKVRGITVHTAVNGNPSKVPLPTRNLVDKRDGALFAANNCAALSRIHRSRTCESTRDRAYLMGHPSRWSSR
jgi:hypothetical protein